MICFNMLFSRKGWIIAGLALLAAFSASPASAQSPELRAYWVDAFHAGFRSTAEVDQLLATVRASNMNAVVVQMRRRGDTYYPSTYEPYAPGADTSFDALDYLINKAHTGSPRIEVHCWFCMYPVWSSEISDPAAPNHVYNQHPEWLTQNTSGVTWDGDNYCLDPGVPGVQQHIYNVIMDVVNRYDVDGINYDYIRYMGKTWGYNPTAVERYNTLYNRTGVPLSTDEEWKRFRRDQVTALVRKLYVNIIAVKPNIKVSASTITQAPGPVSDAGWASTSAYSNVFQDWKAWMEEGILDINMPMTYFDLNGAYSDDWFKWIDFQKTHKHNRHLVVGLGTWLNTIDEVIEQIWDTRELYSGIKAEGQAFYSYYGPYEGGWEHPGTLANYLKSTNYHPNPPYPTPVSVPTMPWKTSPLKGHLKGMVTYGGVQGIDGGTVDITGPVARHTKTDGTGSYASIDLPPGTYTVKTTTAYGSRTKLVQVTAGQVATADFDFAMSNLSVSNVQAVNETSSSITITWDSSGPSTSQVAYGTNKNCSSYTTEDPTLTSDHSVTITGLQPLSAYYYKVISRNPNTADAVSDIYAFVTGPIKPADIIIDNPQASFTGTWATGSSSGDKYGSDYRYCSASMSDVRTATYTPNITTAGDYNVYVCYPEGTNRSAGAPYTINYSGGSQTYSVNQTDNGGTWNLLGKKRFATGTSGYVRLSNATTFTGNVMADAVRFEFTAETTAPSVPQNLQAQAVSDDRINLTWNPSTDNIGVGGYRIYRNGDVVGISTTTSYSDTGLQPNQPVTYTVSAYDTAGNKSGQSAAVTRYTWALPPDAQSISCNRPVDSWQPASSFSFTAVNGFGLGGVSYYRFAWNQNPAYTFSGTENRWTSGTLSTSASTSTAGWYLHLQAYNGENISSGSTHLGPYYYDGTSPQAPSVEDQGQYSSCDALRVSISASDGESGISDLKYAVGTSPYATDVLGLTTVPFTSELEITGLTLSQGSRYYVTVQARNGAGTWGAAGASNGVVAAKVVSSVSRARASSEGDAIMLTEGALSAVFADHIWVQDLDRTGALKAIVQSSAPLGSTVKVAGLWSTSGGTAALTSAEVKAAGNGIISALGMPLGSIGGCDLSPELLGIPGSYGPYNLGLLIKSWGKVISVGEGYFTIGDGASTAKVISSASVAEGDIVGVTGISLFEDGGQGRSKAIRTRSSQDVIRYNP